MRKMLRNLLLVIRTFDKRTFTDAQIIVCVLFGCFFFFQFINALLIHQSPIISFLTSLVFFMFALNSAQAVLVGAYKEQRDLVEQANHQLFQVLLTVKNANKQGFFMQDLEKRGIIKFDASEITVGQGKTTQKKVDAETEKKLTLEEEEIKKFISKKIKKKEKIVN